MKNSSVAAALFALMGLSATQAEVSVELSAEKPSGEIALSYEPEGPAGNSTAFQRGSGEFRDIGQAFVASKEPFELSGITWKIWTFDSQVEGKKIHLKVYLLRTANKGPEPGEEPLFSETGRLPEVLEEHQYLTFRFGKDVKLAPGDACLVLFGFDEPTSEDASAKSIGFERDAGEERFDGRMWSSINGEKFIADKKTMTFFVHGK